MMVRAAAGSLGITIAGTALVSAVQLLLARLLGVESFGVYTYVYSIVTILFLLSRLGIDAVLVRFVAEYRSVEDWGLIRGLLRWSDRWVLGTGIGSGLLLAIAGKILASRLSSELSWTLVAGGLLVPPMAVLGLRHRALQGLLRPALGQVAEQVFRPLILGTIVGICYLSGKVPMEGPMVMVASAVAAAMAVALGTALLKRALPEQVEAVTPRFDRKEWMRVSLPLLLVAGMWRILHQTDILMVGTLLGTTEAGIYGIATRLARIVVLGLVAVNSITAPLISGVHAKRDLLGLQSVVTFSAWCSILVSFPAILLTVLFRKFILGLFGEGFVAAGAVLVILCLGRLVSTVVGPTGWLLNMTGHQRISAKIQTTVTLLNIILNLPAVLLWGIEGAALSTALAFSIQNVWSWWEVKKRLGVDGSVLSSLRVMNARRSGGT